MVGGAAAAIYGTVAGGSKPNTTGDGYVSDSDGDDGPSRILYRSPDGDPPWASLMPPGYNTPAKADGRVHDDYFEAAFADIDVLRECVADWQPTIVRCLAERDPLDGGVTYRIR